MEGNGVERECRRAERVKWNQNDEADFLGFPPVQQNSAGDSLTLSHSQTEHCTVTVPRGEDVLRCSSTSCDLDIIEQKTLSRQQTRPTQKITS
jgi:hypothetical protein